MREFQNGITYTQIITFRAVYEAGNITRAAKKLGISAASVSYSLKSLETQIREPLFTRTTRAIKPTRLGAQLYESSRLAIDDLSAAVEIVCEQNNTPVGTLSLNMAKNIYDVFLKEMLRDFSLAYPSIQLEITLSDFMDQHTEQSIDIGFRFGETVSESMIARPISQGLKPVKVALFASPGYVKQHGQPRSIAELQNHSLIKFRAPTSERLLPLQLRQSGEPNSDIVTLSNLPTAMIVNNTDVMLDMACHGRGVGCLMDAMVAAQFESGEFIPFLEELWCDIPTVYMYYAPENRQSLRVRCFLDFLQARLDSPDEH